MKNPEKKRALFYKIITGLGVVLVAGAIFSTVDFKNQIIAEPAGSYQFSLTTTEFAASNLQTSYDTTVTKKYGDADFVVQSFGDDKPTIQYFLAKKDDNNRLVLAPSGKVFNYSTSATYGGRITNITSMIVNYSGGVLYAQAGEVGEASVYGKKNVITSGTAITFDSAPNYVMLSNSRAETTITSITFNYSCSDPGFIVGRLGEKYNTKSKEGTEYTLTRDGSNISVGSYSGTISVNSSGTFTMSLVNGTVVYTGTISSDYKTLSVTDKSGSNAGSAPTLSTFKRIYVMDDFEGYSQTGTGNSGGKLLASDLRASYYGDYGGGGYSTWITNSSFDTAISSDYVNLTTSMKHGGNQGITVKGWTGGWTRLWSRETFDSRQHYNFGSGNKLTFWTHGAYTNTGCTTASGDSPNLRVQVYYQNFDIDDGNRNSTTYGTGTKDFTITADSGWTQQTITLDPSKNVYAINFMINNSGLNKNVYIPVDDIEISSTPAFEGTKIYEETSTQFTKTYHASVNVTLTTLDVKIGLGANGFIYANAGEDMEPTGYSVSGNTISIVTTGKYSSYTYGTWTGTLSADRSTISIPKSGISGSIKSYVKTDPIVFTEDNLLVNGDESDATLLSKLGKQKGTPWANLDSYTNQLNRDTDHHIQGSASFRSAAISGYKTRVFAAPSLAESIGTFKNVAFWYYVPGGIKYTISLFGLSTATPPASGSASQATSITYEASSDQSGWHYINVGVPSGYRNNIFIYMETSAPSYIDYVTYY